eukprot:c9620_g1_i1 orf=309-521(-)
MFTHFACKKCAHNPTLFDPAQILRDNLCDGLPLKLILHSSPHLYRIMASIKEHITLYQPWLIQWSTSHCT